MKAKNKLKKYKAIIITLVIIIVIFLALIFFLKKSIKVYVNKDTLIRYKLNSNKESSNKLVFSIPDNGEYDLFIKNPKVNVSDYIIYSLTDSTDKVLTKGIIHTDDNTKIKIPKRDSLDEVFLNITYLSLKKSILEFDMSLSLRKRETLKVSTLINGPDLNKKMILMANNGIYTDDGYEFGKDENIETIRIAKTIDEKYKTNDNIVSEVSEKIPIYMWYSDHTIYFYSENKIAFNEYSFKTFSNFIKLKNINDLKYFDTSKVTNMAEMFSSDENLSDIKALAYFDTSNVEYMNNLFDRCTTLADIYPLYNFDTSKVKDISSMFNYTAIVDISPLEFFDVSKVVTIDNIFNGTKINSLDSIKNWDVSNVENMRFAFSNTFIKDVDSLTNWNTSKVKNMNGLFYDCFKLSDISGLKEWKTSHVKWFDYFLKGTKIIDLDALCDFDTTSLESISGAFSDIRTLKNINGIRNWNVSKVESLESLFQDTSFTDLSPLEKWDISNVNNMKSTFAYTKIKNVDSLKFWNVSKVKTFERCFYYSSLESLDGLKDWNMKSAQDISYIFMLTKNLKSTDAINNWNISNVNNFHWMFKKSSSIYPSWNGTWDNDGSFVKNV